MDKNEMELIVGALDRINRCLDERFEKDANLYIAPAEVEKLKRLIYVGNYPHIVSYYTKMKKYSAEILANVLIKNAWLMRKKDFDVFQPIFKGCNNLYFQSVMEESVFDNKIEMPSEFRLQLLSTFLERSDAETCEQMLKQNLIFLNYPQLRALCICQILKDKPLLIRYEQFNDYAEDSPNILTQDKIFSEIFPSKEFTDAFRKKIFDEQIKNEASTWRFWMNRLAKEDIPFIMDQFKSYCRLNSSKLFECKTLSSKLQFIMKKDFKTFAKKFAEACACMDGDKKAAELARPCISRIQAGSEDENILMNAFNNCGVQNVKRGELADIDEIIDYLPKHNFNPRAGAWLAASFDIKYYNNCFAMLDKLKDNVPEKKFTDFLIHLVKSKERHLKYLLYAIEYADKLEDEKDEEDFIDKLLKHIQNRNILQKYKADSNIGKIVEFVKSEDFDLFLELNQF